MRYLALPLALLSSSIIASEPDAPSQVVVDGKFEFLAIDANDQLLIEKWHDNFAIPADAMGCILEVEAEDEFFTSYPSALELRKLENNALAVFFRTKAVWIDEGGNYWNKPVINVSLRVYDVATDGWTPIKLKGNHAIIPPSEEEGVAAYHHLTMGQPMTVRINKSGNPTDVTINIKPLGAALARHARDCLKAVNGEL